MFGENGVTRIIDSKRKTWENTDCVCVKDIVEEEEEEKN